MIVIGWVVLFLVGYVLGLLGGGGAILSVPAFVYFFALPASAATGYALFLVGVTSSVGAATMVAQGLVNFRTALIFLFPSMIGVSFSRSILLPRMPEILSQWGSFTLTKDRIILLVFALVMGWASWSMLRGRREEKTRESNEVGVRLPAIAAYGLVTGMLIGFVGAGGGFLIIPALVGLARLGMKSAIGTSLFIITVNSLYGFANDVWSGAKFDWFMLLAGTLLSLIGLFLGMRTGKRVSPEKLRRWFGFLVLLVALFILTREMFSLVSIR